MHQPSTTPLPQPPPGHVCLGFAPPTGSSCPSDIVGLLGLLLGLPTSIGPGRRAPGSSTCGRGLSSSINGAYSGLEGKIWVAWSVLRSS